ncbi:hypothetical protein [Polyangium sp. y55x31]|uniref:RCC1 domain-containing protein n=1 Tax=Polyangium sp. y55x31 TaxID=3042688 RepID=UPI0024830E8A|nr:hypothetical protein [Polyangium sp. y55x31]MDI1475412.1 hypothetical protein [Polyangium sp. y55x31]
MPSFAFVQFARASAAIAFVLIASAGCGGAPEHPAAPAPSLPPPPALAGVPPLGCAAPLADRSAKATALVASELHTCALLDGGRVACWGRDEKRGRMNLCEGKHAALAVELPFERGDQVATSMEGTCTLSQGSVRCTEAIFTALCDDHACGSGEVRALAGASRIAVGDHHVCAIVRGEVVCVAPVFSTGVPPVLGNLGGREAKRAPAGAGGEYARSKVPIRGATLLTAGFGFSCATDAAGAVWCWGQNYNGVLGVAHGKEQDDGVLHRVAAFDGVVHLESNRATVCAITRAGDTYCWGADFDDGPVKMPFERARDVAIGDGFVCAVDGANRVTCAGKFRDVLGAEPLSFAGKPIEIASGGGRLCARLESGAIACAGISGYLGDGGGLPKPVNDGSGAMDVRLVHEPRYVLGPRAE